MLEPEAAARAAAARRRVSRAAGLLREARGDLAGASEGVDTVAALEVKSPASLDEALDAVRLAGQRYAEIDVVILARPRRGSGAPHGRR